MRRADGEPRGLLGGAREGGWTCESHICKIERPSGERARIEAECAIIVGSGVFSACLSKSREGREDGKEAPIGK